MRAPVTSSESFDDAASYDRFMGRWSRMVAPAFLGFACTGPVETALDVGCGTGALVDTLTQRLPGCRVTGIDLSANLVAACREWFPSARYRFDCADATALPYPDATFGTTLSLLVLMLLEAPERAAAEMRRVTRPGGTVAACTWDADHTALISVVWDEARALDADAPSQVGRTHCAHPGTLGSLWRAAGLRDVSETGIDLMMRFESFEDFWDPLAAGVGPMGAYIANAPGPMRAHLKARVRRRLTGERGDHAFTLGARALAVRGRVPGTK